MRRSILPWLVLVLVSASTSGCYTTSAMRQSERIVRAGFAFDDLGPWVLVAGPASVLVAGGALAIGSIVPLTRGVDPREPDAKWFTGYSGPMRAPEDVGLLCHRDGATWVTGMRSEAGGSWAVARHEKWHFPVCIEALPGRYELEVHYFARQHEDDRELSVSRQAESTAPSIIVWHAEAGQVDALVAEISTPQPAPGMPPQRHIPRSRALGTTWWELQASSWVARIDRQAAWDALDGPVPDQRSAWVEWQARKR
jgi:hypothetical protein